MKLGPIIILPAKREPFYRHFLAVWNRMDEEKRRAADAGIVHVAYNPGEAPKQTAAAMNTKGEEVRT